MPSCRPRSPSRRAGVLHAPGQPREGVDYGEDGEAVPLPGDFDPDVHRDFAPACWSSREWRRSVPDPLYAPLVKGDGEMAGGGIRGHPALALGARIRGKRQNVKKSKRRNVKTSKCQKIETFCFRTGGSRCAGTRAFARAEARGSD